MSVLIKGMDMPISCNACPMLEGNGLDGLCHAASRWLDDDEYWRWYLYPEGDADYSRPLNCPLVEVPVFHGRLIDADALTKVMCEGISPSDGNEGFNHPFDILRAISNTPTVIEAEPRWIPCSERPPEEDGRYLVTRYDYVTEFSFVDILWYEKRTWWNRRIVGDFAVKAWMSLPEPYKEGSEA